MIFVTVGTHEQQFDRLVKYMDKWAGCHDEKVIIQTGYSAYIPQNCKYQKMFSFQEMQEYVKKARIIITHGGPSSFIMPLQNGKIPIVVPRQKRYGEHVNDHQLEFCRQVFEKKKNIILVEKTASLKDVLDKYDMISYTNKNEMCRNNKIFCKNFEKIVNGLLS